MAHIFLERSSAVNINLLHEQLSAIDGYEAVSVSPSGIRVYFSGDADTNNMKAIVSAHDGEALSSKELISLSLKSEISSLKAEVGNIDNLTETKVTPAIKLIYKAMMVSRLIES